ncbi:MAG: T9SS type A sorting domain-containing protein [Bacteroidota bacterium]|jgi:hypothetical protein
MFRFFSITILFFFLTSVSFSQGDPCTAASLLNLWGPYSGTCSGGGSVAQTITPSGMNGFNSSAPTGLSNSCVNGSVIASSQDYWYSFTAPANMGTTEISVSGAGGGLTNVELQLYSSTGSCPSPSLSLITCGVTTGVFTPTAGVTYYIRIYGEAASIPAMAKFTLCARTQPTNDLCTNAINLTSGSNVCGGTLGASGNAASTTGSCSTDQYVWYTFTTGNPVGCLSFAGSNITTGDPSCPSSAFLIYSGCSALGGASGTLNGLNTSNNTFNDFSTADLTTALLPNTTYYVAVGSGANATYCFQYNAGVTPAANDVCSGATAIGTSPALYDNASAGCEYTYIASQDANITPANVCAGSLENVSWFTFQTQASPATSNVVISFANISCNNGGGGFQTGLFTGANCSSLTVGTSGTAICASGASGTVTYTINNSPAGTVYYIAMDGNAGSNCHFTVSGSNIVPLPIELLSFDAILQSHDKVELRWVTSSELNNNFFTVQRTEDGLEFEDIGSLPSAAVNGNSSTNLNYTLFDNNPLPGVSYYRLKQTDLNGTSSYSAIRKITIEPSDELDLTIQPNPSDVENTPYLHFRGKSNEKVNVEIINLSGRVLSIKEINLSEKGEATINLKHNLPAGVYFISVTTPSGNKVTRKMAVN